MKNLLNKNKSGKEKGLLGAALVLLLSLAAAIAFGFEGEDCADKYSFVNKRFACFEKHVMDKKDYRELRSELLEYINEEKEVGNVAIVSIFFRDLEAGPTMGIEERTDYAPASLLKLPNALILMRLQEEGEIDLAKNKMSYAQLSPGSSLAGYEIMPNTSYSLNELIFRSLANSDNVANRLILQYINSIDKGRNLLSEIYRDLGIIEVTDSVSSAVNTKGYSTIFRMLYNSSFLSPDSSEKLLNMMGESSSIGGLKSGVPHNIRISHKYGERVIKESDAQLHDCGIVYYPQNPYLLCVMTRGRDLKKLQEVITAISAKVYQEFDSRKLE